MSEDGFHPRPSWDGSVDRERDSDAGHGPAVPSRNGIGNGNGGGAGSTNGHGRMPHYVPSSESLNHQPHPTQQMFDEHSGAPPTPTKKSTSPPRRSSIENTPLASGFGSGAGAGAGMGRWAEAGPMAGIGSAGGVGMGMGMAAAMGAQSELGHGYAPPRGSIDSERGGGSGVGGDDDDDRETAASAAEMATLVEPSFDENILRALCETDVSASFLSGLAGRASLRSVR